MRACARCEDWPAETRDGVLDVDGKRSVDGRVFEHLSASQAEHRANHTEHFTRKTQQHTNRFVAMDRENWPTSETEEDWNEGIETEERYKIGPECTNWKLRNGRNKREKEKNADGRYAWLRRARIQRVTKHGLTLPFSRRSPGTSDRYRLSAATR